MKVLYPVILFEKKTFTLFALARDEFELLRNAISSRPKLCHRYKHAVHYFHVTYMLGVGCGFYSFYPTIALAAGALMLLAPIFGDPE